MRARYVVGAAAIVFVVASACSRGHGALPGEAPVGATGEEMRAPELSRGFGEGALEIAGRAIDVHALEPDLQVSGASRSYRQQFGFGAIVRDFYGIESGGGALDYDRDLYVLTGERIDGRMQESGFVFSAAFDLEHVVSRGPNEFVVVGSTERDAAVIELWTLAWPSGAPEIGLKRESSVPVGFPLWDDLTVLTGIRGGGVHVPPSERRPPRMLRERVYAGSAGGAVRSVSVDLQGRYLVALFEQGSAVELFFLDGQTPSQTLASEATHQFLVGADSVIAFADSDQGRGVYVGTAGEDSIESALFLWDAENDCVFEGAEVLPDFWAYYSEDSTVDWYYDLTALGYELP